MKKIVASFLLFMSCGPKPLCFSIETHKTKIGNFPGSCGIGSKQVVFGGRCDEGATVFAAWQTSGGQTVEKQVPCQNMNWFLAAPLEAGQNVFRASVVTEMFEVGRVGADIEAICPMDPTLKPGPELEFCQ